MDVRTTVEDEGTSVVVTGEADADNCRELGEAILGNDVVGPVQVDLSELTFLDSSAVSELLRIHKLLGEQDVVMSIVTPSPAVHRVLEITGLLEIFGLRSS